MTCNANVIIVLLVLFVEEHAALSHAQLAATLSRPVYDLVVAYLATAPEHPFTCAGCGVDTDSADLCARCAVCCTWCGNADAFDSPYGQICAVCHVEASRDERFDTFRDGGR